MKLNQREKILLGILAFLILGGIYYYFALIPQDAYLKQVETKLQQLEQTREEIGSYTNPDGKMRKQYEELDRKIAAITAKYFPELVQERIIRIVDTMLSSAGLEGKVLNFTPLTLGTIVEKKPLPKEKPFSLQELAVQLLGDKSKGNEPQPFTGDGNAYKMELTLEFEGTYPQIMSFMNKVETSPRKILVNSITISSAAGPRIKGVFNLHFYGFPKLHLQDGDYLTWDIFDVYGRGNPFIP